MVKSISPQMEIRNKIKNKLHNFRLVFGFLTHASSECMQVAKPFLCLYMFGLCRSGEELLPSPDQCETVRSSACAVEWQRTVAILGINQLPQCESLPSTSEELNDCLREFKYYYCDY